MASPTDTQPTSGPVMIDGFEIDAYITEEHTLEAEVTDYPVESGGTITDNVRVKPRKVRVEGLVSDTPIGRMKDIRASRAGTATDTHAADEPPTTPSQDALTKLEAVFALRLPVTIVTSLKSYKSMVLETLAVPRSAETGKALKFTATFKQIVVVENQRVKVKVVNSGPKTTKTGTPFTSCVSCLQGSGAEILFRKRIGKTPPLTTDHTAPIGQPAGTWLHFDKKLLPDIRPDGYLDAKGLYKPYGAPNGAAPTGDTLREQVIASTSTGNGPTHYNEPDRTYRNQNGQVITQTGGPSTPGFWQSATTFNNDPNAD